MNMQCLFCSMGMQNKCAAFMLQLGCAIWDLVYMNVNAVYFVEVALMDMQYQYKVSFFAAWACNINLQHLWCSLGLQYEIECIWMKSSVFCGGGTDGYAISICMGMQHKCAAFMLQLGCVIWDWVYMNVNAVYFVEVVLMDMQYQYAVSF